VTTGFQAKANTYKGPSMFCLKRNPPSEAACCAAPPPLPLARRHDAGQAAPSAQDRCFNGAQWLLSGRSARWLMGLLQTC